MEVERKSREQAEAECRQTEETEQRRLLEEEQQRIASEEAERQQAQEEVRLQALEEARRQAEDEETKRQAEEVARWEEEQREHELQQQERDREAALRAQEEQQKAEMEHLKRIERKKVVGRWLKDNGFSSVIEPKKSSIIGPVGVSSKYALHVAAEKGDEKMVEMLLQEGADRKIKNSAGKTPSEVAKKKDKNGSHIAVMRMCGA